MANANEVQATPVTSAETTRMVIQLIASLRKDGIKSSSFVTMLLTFAVMILPQLLQGYVRTLPENTAASIIGTGFVGGLYIVSRMLKTRNVASVAEAALQNQPSILVPGEASVTPMQAAPMRTYEPGAAGAAARIAGATPVQHFDEPLAPVVTIERESLRDLLENAAKQGASSVLTQYVEQKLGK
jgi:hypothetical protein